MKIDQKILEQIIEEEIKNALEEEGLLKHLGKTVAPFALGAAVASGVVDKGHDKSSQQAVQAIDQTKSLVKKDTEENPSNRLELSSQYKILKTIKAELEANNSSVFNDATIEGRAATALALAIGGTEVYGTLKSPAKMFSMMGGTDNKMQGFAQFNTAFHKKKINTPEKYTKFLGNILTGKNSFPNGKTRMDAASKLAAAIENNKVEDGADLIRWMRTSNFGGSNWQGIDDGWDRIPGVADSLVSFIRG